MVKKVEIFIGQKDAKKVRTFCMFPPKIRTYRTDFDETKGMFF